MNASLTINSTKKLIMWYKVKELFSKGQSYVSIRNKSGFGGAKFWRTLLPKNFAMFNPNRAVGRKSKIFLLLEVFRFL